MRALRPVSLCLAGVNMTRRGLMVLGLAAAALAGAGGSVFARFAAELAAARRRLEGRSQVIQSRFGPVEYAIHGEGPPVLMLHGTGGGFDQGLAFAQPLVGLGWKVVAPSRFGYLRSAYPEDPSLEHQADAIVDLLDELGIARAPVIGGSAGALSALQFAIRHPSRCSAVVAVVPATYVPGRDAVRPGRLGQAIIAYGLKSDFLFWMGMTMAEDQMIATLLATDPELVRQASAQEQARVRAILRDILPVSARTNGLLNDGRQAGTPVPMALEKIAVPTLALSVEDDRFGTADAARHIATRVPGGRLIIYPSGGHVWLGHDEEMWSAIDSFLKPYSAASM
jgi:2-hydroxy-6-oxonona-2,4-dienedioate hydrolase